MDFASLMIVSGSQTQALTSTPATLAQFSATGGSAGASAGTPAVQADRTNNRIKVVEGLYRVSFTAEVLSSVGDITLTFALGVNAVAEDGLQVTAPVLRDVLNITSGSLSPAEVAANTVAAQDLTFTGLLTTDQPLGLAKPTAQAGLGIGMLRAKSANTLEVSFINATGSPITPTASQVYVLSLARIKRQLVSFTGLVSIGSSDVPGTLSLFDDPAEGAAGGAPKTLCPLTILASSSANATVTFYNARFDVESVRA